LDLDFDFDFDAIVLVAVNREIASIYWARELTEIEPRELARLHCQDRR